MPRPYRGRPMFVGVLLTGFGGDWLTKGSCHFCGSPHETARCSRCQCGICEDRGLLLARAGQGSSLACCRSLEECAARQENILDFWEAQTGESLP